MQKKILIVLGDAGSANYILPVLKSLQAQYRVTILADRDGQAGHALQSVRHFAFREDHNIIPFLTDVDLVLCGTASKRPQLWLLATRAAKTAGIPVAWFGDFFGSGLEAPARDLVPDAMAIFDDSSQVHFLTAHRNLVRQDVRVVGNPAFDALATYDLPAHRADAREALGVDDSERLVIYSASSLAQFDIRETLAVLVPWLEEQRVRFSIAFHPADYVPQRAAIEAITADLRHVLDGRFIEREAGHNPLKGIDFVAAADLLITDYSTLGVEAMVAGIPTAFLMLESAQEYQEKRGLTFPFFPILDRTMHTPTPAIPVFKKEHIRTLASAFQSADNTRRRTRLRERFGSISDGKAGARFLSFVQSELGVAA